MQIRGECSRCGLLIPYFDPANDAESTVYVMLTIPGRGIYAKTVWQAELICKNQLQCVERQKASA